MLLASILAGLAVSALSQGQSKSDLACSLNGVVTNSTNRKCLCDTPWKGSACDILDIKPRPVGALPSYGYSPNVTSWGGNIIANDKGGYDMWVSEMVNDCGLKVKKKITKTSCHSPFSKACIVFMHSCMHAPRFLITPSSPTPTPTPTPAHSLLAPRRPPHHRPTTVHRTRRG